MGKHPVKKPHHNKSIIQDYVSKPSSVLDLEDDSLFVVSFRHLDPNQGASFHTWQAEGMLAQAMSTLAGYCHGTMEEQKGTKFTVYGDFPARSAFTPPPYVPQDAKWARIHVDGTQIIAGHIVKNTFYVVFLDSTHQFYITRGADN